MLHSKWILSALSALTLAFVLTPSLAAQSSSAFALTCGSAPCRLPNVQVSSLIGGLGNLTLAVNPQNPQQFFSGVSDPNCTTLQGLLNSNDGGSHWTHTCLNEGPFFGVLPGVTGDYDLNGTLFVSGEDTSSDLSSIIDVISKSTDNGAHWTTVQEAVPAILGEFADHPWLAVDKNPTSPHANTVYISTTQFGVVGGKTEISVSHSTDGGANFTTVPVDPPQPLTSEEEFSHLTIGSDGTLYLTWQRCDILGRFNCGDAPASMMLSKSTDGGVTWSTPVVVATVKLTPDPHILCVYGALPVTDETCVTNFPVSAVSGTGASARVFVTFYNWTGTQMQVEVASSQDGGKTFAAPVRVSSSNHGDEFSPWITAADGQVVVTWLDRRSDPANKVYQPVLAVSKDGASFGPSRALSAIRSNVTDGLGDFRSHIALGSTIYANWPDTRTQQIQEELGGAQF